MEIKEKKRLMTIAYWVMIIVVISFCIFLFFYLNSSGKQCIANPIKYYAKFTNQFCFCKNGSNFIDTITP